jgi:hypothetical protein
MKNIDEEKSIASSQELGTYRTYRMAGKLARLDKCMSYYWDDKLLWGLGKTNRHRESHLHKRGSRQQSMQCMSPINSLSQSTPHTNKVHPSKPSLQLGYIPHRHHPYNEYTHEPYKSSLPLSAARSAITVYICST